MYNMGHEGKQKSARQGGEIGLTWVDGVGVVDHNFESWTHCVSYFSVIIFLLVYTILVCVRLLCHLCRLVFFNTR